jgi:sugar phosphate isomerase/epimerase
MTLSRRQLLASGAGLMAASAAARGAQMTTARNRKPGLQLYTIRSEMQKDVPGSLKRVAQIGYKEVEFAGYFDHKPPEIRKMVADLGLTAPSLHVPLDAIRAKPAQLITDAQQAGHHYLVLAWIPPEERTTAEMWKRHAALLNSFGAQCKAAGLRFAYHNHDFEFTPVGELLPYDILMQSTDPAVVQFELDMYWAKKGGQDLNALFAKRDRRIAMVHVKDMLPNGEMTDVGLGTIPFAQVLGAPPAASVEHYFVENDDTKTPFQSIATSCKALTHILAGLPV